ncbi:hypothetical protein [Flavisphingomonas formosensis]|uniref:hypothetical protein n=1 Tax=Flavisphingomonas formosensis TaxID=861534 RepID=UPI0012FA9020|nr:hypothetical protein [Sphingomonas formosensis]
MKSPTTVAALSDFGRVRLSQHFYMRDFLFSDIAAIHGLANVPDDPDLAIAAGTRLCTDLLEPLQRVFGRIAIRSAYRSAEVNGLGNAMQKAGRKGYNCASNERNYAGHIWDRRDADGHMGATACIVLPEFVDAFPNDGDWTALAWWIHDHLPYSELQFFPTNWAFNINWRENPVRAIHSYAGWKEEGAWKASGYLTRFGMANHEGSHRAQWQRLAASFPIG